MSEQCVCGHPKESHFFGERTTTCHGAGPCFCPLYRPVLPWPDSEGWWWCRSEIIDSLCYVKAVDDELFRRDLLRDDSAELGEIVISVAGLHGLRDGYATRGDFMSDGYGPARFVKCLEQSPFEASGV